jgi:dihydrofolate reductase
MGKVVVFTNLTLDGVMQAPGSPDEDLRGGFTRGGWAAPYGAMAEAGGGSMDFGGGLLFGRRTYERFYSFWPQQKGNPFSAILENMPKYVASRTLQDPLPWKNSTLLEGDGAKAVAQLKQTGPNLLIFGSGELVQSLMRRGVVDEYLLLIHPLVLGTGRRLFGDGGAPASLRLVDSKTTSKGVVIATYQPASDGAATA